MAKDVRILFQNKKTMMIWVWLS